MSRAIRPTHSSASRANELDSRRHRQGRRSPSAPIRRKRLPVPHRKPLSGNSEIEIRTNLLFATNHRRASANQGWWYISNVSAAERKAARASWEGRVFRNGWEEMADFDALFWDRLAVEERAEAVWELSKELHAIAHPETHERRLPRSAYRVERR